MFEHLTLDEVWRYRSSTTPEATFLVRDDPTAPQLDRSLTFAETAREVDALAATLAGLGVAPGDRVVVHLDNSVEHVVSLLAVLQAGGVAVPTITHYTATELGYVAEHSGCAAIITGPTYEGMVLQVAAGCTTPPAVVVSGEVRARGGSPSPGRDDVLPAAARAGDRVALLLYTSGTTADPKGVMLSHRACLTAGHDNAGELRVRPEDRLYCVLPLFHVNALSFQLLPALMTGATLVLGPVFSARHYWEVVRRQRVTIGNLTNGPLRILLGQAPSDRDRDHAVRLMTYALPLDGAEIVGFEQRFGAALSMGYGLTESLACGTRTPPYLDPRREWQSIGMASPGWDVRVVDEAGAELPAGSIGELTLRGPGLMSGYFRDEAATAATLRDGWLHTGDLCYVDERGYVFFHDRLKDVIKVKGENVAAGEVERVAGAYPGVGDCAAVGVPDPILGERIVLYVATAPGAGHVDVDGLREHCAAHLARFKVPGEILLLDALPTTSIGKVRKGELRRDAHASTGGPR
jgi:crotonobetaine/carnitine-CoA ligase